MRMGDPSQWTKRCELAALALLTASIHQLLGNHASRWSAHDGAVPKQVCNLLLQALHALKFRCEQAMEVDPATAKRYADWAESLSGKRTSTGSAAGA